MKWLIPVAVFSACLIEGCASTTHAQPRERLAHATVVPVEMKAPKVEGHPITSVVVTQCNLIVAVYMTMPNGNLLRFDRTADVPAEQLLAMAYTATRSERVEVNCDAGIEPGIVGYEAHAPI